MESEKIETSLRMAYRDNRLTEEQVARLQKCPTCGHEWSSRIVNRTRYRDAICPSCRNGGRPRSFVRNIETGCVYATYSDAARAVGIRKGSSIKRAIDMGGCCGGYHWEYVDD